MTRRILVTSALPYVNGHIHLGHLVEYVQTDIWARFQRMRGNRVAFICADDTHGTATMIRARQEGRSEQEIITEMSGAHRRDFADFDVVFTHYGSTDSASNRHLVAEIWSALRAARDPQGGAIVVEREVTQLYDPKAGTFLADRFVKGTCPRCNASDQYGDSCDKCSATYSPSELTNPVSTLSGAVPELRSAKHYFVRLEPFRAFLGEWTQGIGEFATRPPLRPAIANWLKNAFLADELRDWDVSRPAPYFGFEIPDAPGHYFYVWVDAPVGYLASLSDACDQRLVADRNPRLWWPKRGDIGFDQEDVEIHHFIGKDITYFHALFWPAMLRAADYKLPTAVHVHGFLTVNGEKMSKSKGTFVCARTYLDTIGDPSYLRYYYASKLGADADDLDLNLDELIAKVNSDLVGKVVNLAARTAKFVQGAPLTHRGPERAAWDALNAAAFETITAAYEEGNFALAMREIMALADYANRYVEDHAPWALAKDPAKAKELRTVCSVALSMFWNLVVYLTPILPRLSARVLELFGQGGEVAWGDAITPPGHAPIRAYTHLMTRLDPAKVKAMVEASQDEVAPAAVPATATATATASASTKDDDASLKAAPIAPTIAFEDFAKVDLRVARIVAAEDVPGAKKIIKLRLSLGGESERTVFAGIKTAYAADQLVGRLIVFVANLAPKTMSFGISEGMALAAGPGAAEIYLLAPDTGAKPGQRVH